MNAGLEIRTPTDRDRRLLKALAEGSTVKETPEPAWARNRLRLLRERHGCRTTAELLVRLTRGGHL